MNVKILSMKLILVCVLVSCQRTKEKTFEEQATELIKEVNEQNRKENEAKLKQNDFSDGVQEIMEYFDYNEPVIAKYTNIITIKSTADFDKLKNENPSSIKSIYIDNYNAKIEIDDISVLDKLEYLKVRSIDSIPNGFYNLKNLKAFIAANELKCKIDGRITKLSNLEYLELLFTHTELPNEIEELRKLETIRLYNFSHNQPYENIYQIPNLETLWIRFSNVTQLDGISNLKNLKILVTNKVSSEIGDLNLTGLNVGENNDETYPVELSRLKNLVAFYWQGNRVRESPPEFLSELNKLEYLEIRGCSNFKEIPQEFNELSNLKRFEIIFGHGEFTGKIDHLDKINDIIRIR